MRYPYKYGIILQTNPRIVHNGQMLIISCKWYSLFHLFVYCMKTGIGKLLQIAQGDRSMIGALLLQAVFTGIFVGALELEANAVFLESFGAAKVPLGLMISGAAGILIATVYSYFSKQLGVRAFGIYNLVAVMAMTAALIFGFLLLEIQQLDFVIFVIAGPLILITLLGFWTTVRGFLSPSRGKQLTGLIDATLIGGMILSFIVTPLLESFSIISLVIAFRS